MKQELEKLFELKEKGIITEEQFNEKKKTILESSFSNKSSKINIFSAYINCIRDFFNTSKIISRHEFFSFQIINIIIFLILLPFLGITIFNYLFIVYLIYILTIGLSVTIRRLKTVNKSIIYAFIPFIIPVIFYKQLFVSAELIRVSGFSLEIFSYFPFSFLAFILFVCSIAFVFVLAGIENNKLEK